MARNPFLSSKSKFDIIQAKLESMNPKQLKKLVEQAKSNVNVNTTKTSIVKTPDDIRALEKLYHRFFPSEEGEDVSRLPHFIIALDKVLSDFAKSEMGEDTSSDDDEEEDDDEDDEDSSNNSSKDKNKSSDNSGNSGNSNDDEDDGDKVTTFKKNKKKKDNNLVNMEKDGLTKASVIPEILRAYVENSNTTSTKRLVTKDPIDDLLEESAFQEEIAEYMELARGKAKAPGGGKGKGRSTTPWQHMLKMVFSILAKNNKGKNIAELLENEKYSEFETAWAALGKSIVSRKKNHFTRQSNKSE